MDAEETEKWDKWREENKGVLYIVNLLDLRDGIWIIVLMLMGFSFLMGILLGDKFL